MLNNEIEQVKETEKKYTFRPLGAADVAPMCRIISKIGINEFAKCFGSEEVLKLVERMKNEKAANVTDIAGLQVVLEIVQVIVSHVSDCEKDIFALLASVSGMKLDAVRELDLATFTEMVVDFIKKPEFKDFIGVVSKLFK